MIGAVDGSVDPGASVAISMADAMAAEGAYNEALWWLELAGEHAELDPEYADKRAQWIRLVRRGTGDVQQGADGHDERAAERDVGQAAASALEHGQPGPQAPGEPDEEQEGDGGDQRRGDLAVLVLRPVVDDLRGVGVGVRRIAAGEDDRQ